MGHIAHLRNQFKSINTLWLGEEKIHYLLDNWMVPYLNKLESPSMFFLWVTIKSRILEALYCISNEITPPFTWIPKLFEILSHSLQPVIYIYIFALICHHKFKQNWISIIIAFIFQRWNFEINSISSSTSLNIKTIHHNLIRVTVLFILYKWNLHRNTRPSAK